MFLQKFDELERIVIQCHDSPDADSIGAGYALYVYFKEKGKDVHLVYSGVNRITKPGLRMMVEKMEIPVKYVEELPACDVLITVDCQYEGGNITRFDTPLAAMVDHHPSCVPTNDWCYIKSEYGSCCTVVWLLLTEAGFDVNKNTDVATALYYGLYSDTGQLSEIYCASDREMRDTLRIDRELFKMVVNSNLSREELQIAGEALTNYYYNEQLYFAVVKTRPCDPNLLGVISDMVIQVAGIDVCVVYNETPIGYKLSIRSGKQPYEASHLAESIAADVGSGGGHMNKAGGFVHREMLTTQYKGQAFSNILRKRIESYILKAREG
ncbi:MAG: DHH family phosphoesterase [Lachnospiraceae bacterium]|nr:DHH family phosphoesterase [Lachnospiraceae bacterium]